MKNQNVTGVLLLILGTILLVFASDYGFRDFAFSFGEVMGSALILTLVVLLIVAVTPYKKKVSLILVLGISWIGATGKMSYEFYVEGTKDRETRSSLVQLIEDFSSGNELSTVPSEPETESILVFFQNYFAKNQSIHTEYTNEVAARKLDTLLSPENLTNAQIAKQSKIKTTSFLNVIANFEKRSLALIDNGEMALSKRKDRDGRAAYRGFQKTKQVGVQATKQFWEIQRGLVTAFGGVLDIAIANEGKLYVQGGQLKFETQELVDRYNELLTRISTLARQQTQLGAQNLQRMEDRKNKLIKELN